MKGTGKWTVQQSAELSVAAPTIASALDGRFLSGLKDERVKAAAFLEAQGVPAAAAPASVDKKQLVADVRAALYASKICSYAQGMNLIRAKSAEQKWNLNLGDMARIWKGGCIIRAAFLGDIKAAYDRNAALDSLLVDPFFAKGLAARQAAWRRVVGLGVSTGVAMPVRARQIGAGVCVVVLAFALTRCTCCVSGHVGVAGVLRQLPPRAHAGEPGAGAARLLWEPHLRAHRHGGLAPHAVERRQQRRLHHHHRVHQLGGALTLSARGAEQYGGRGRGTHLSLRQPRSDVTSDFLRASWRWIATQYHYINLTKKSAQAHASASSASAAAASSATRGTGTAPAAERTA